jgi:arsenate reductase
MRRNNSFIVILRLKMKNLLVPILTLTLMATACNPKTDFNKDLYAYCTEIEKNIENISDERKEGLKAIAQYISESRKSNDSINLTFICTHNSRRSHFGQIWMYTAAKYYGINNVSTFSGGTESTAANIRAMKALERAGFTLTKTAQEVKPDNFIYELGLGEGLTAQECFSKVYDDAANPDADFAAIMVCSSADEACPFVPGASKRIAIPYIDPKRSDDTPEEAATYDETCKLIATEIFYVASLVEI